MPSPRLDVSALLCMLLSVRALAAGPVVQTTFGPLVGKTEGQCHAFLGVPYADPPVGPLRFNNPVDWHKKWTKPRQATKFGNYCIQTVGPLTGGKEDCLFLNIWGPTQGAHAGLPVMVFLHGGAFNAGSGDQPAPPVSPHSYDGCSIATHGVVVVSLNYRLGMFGFLTTIEANGRTLTNFGVKDQRSALRWVRSQIHHFGGDKNRITLFGESAGAYSVMHHLISPKSAGLFARGIMESNPWLEIGSRDFGLAMSAKVITIAGCRGTPSQIIQCMRSKPVYDLTAALGKADLAATGAVWCVVIDGDEISGYPSDLLKAGKFTKNIPILAGINTQEASLFVYPLYPVSMDKFWYERFINMWVAANASGITQMRPFSPATVQRVFQQYPAKPLENRATASALVTDGSFVAGTHWILRNLLQHKATPKLYSYRFNHARSAQCRLAPGAYHTSELDFVFGHTFTATCPFTLAETLLSAQMQRYWTQFAKTGDPNGNSNTTEGLKWPAFDAKASSLVLDEQISIEQQYRKAHIDFWFSTPFF